jgi:hypothetical protein
MGIFKKMLIIMSAIVLLSLSAVGQDDAGINEGEISQPAKPDSSNLDKLDAMLGSGKPTLAYFYYSVACSCTAVQCSLAFDAIAKIDELDTEYKNLNYISIDAYYEEAAESLYQCQVVPLVVGYNSAGKEVARVEWEIDGKAINEIINEIK